MNAPFARLLAGSVLAAAVSAAWAQEAPLRFEVNRFDVTGNTLLTPAEVEAAVAPFKGKDKDFGDVQRALEALEQVYHDRGYNVVAVELPEQELTNGVVHFVVVQTKIGKVNVSGNKYFDAANIRRSLPALKEGESPNIRKISSQLKVANDSPAKKVTLKLQSADNDEVDANLNVVDESPWRAMLNLDNTGTGSTGKTHVSASLQHANLFGRDHVGSIQYTTTAEKPSKVAVYGAGYHIPLYEQGDSIDLFGNYSNVDSGSITAGIFNLAVSGRGTVWGGRYNQVLAKRGEFEPRLIWGIDHKAFKNSVLLGSTDFGNNVTVHPFSLTYMGTETMPAGEGSVSAALVRNIPGGKRGGDADFTAARAGARPGYTIVRLAGTIAHAYASGWQVRAIANAQLTGDALVPGEQFGAGGSASVRGFNEREVSADSGLNTNVELYTPELCGGKWQCRTLGFVDAAYAKRNKALPGEYTSTTVASVGLGLRLALGNAVSLQADWGHIVREGVVQSSGRNRVHVRMSIAY
ncbi:MAG TPA: ShlB/FhaC/HecB family hemolysin secretion/activation protein [Telluria sp.]|nr:ShlB/FhaC/HecB family hemolysin secretion/activation protein [Telluria sp.]